jgi:hypothetical protein
MIATTITGLPALLIILVILALIVLGAVAVGRGAKRGVDRATHRDHQEP